MSNNENKYLLLKSHLINALLPDFLKHLFWNSIFTLFLYIIYYLINQYYFLGYNLEIIFSLVFLTILFSTIKISKDLIIILNTQYKFYVHHLEYSFSFFREETHSINYSQITDVEIKRTIWDKLCGVGDIIIHTGNDDYHEGGDSLIIKDIRKPNHLKEQIITRIHKK